MATSKKYYKKGDQVIALDSFTLEMLGGVDSGYRELTPTEIAALPQPVTPPVGSTTPGNSAILPKRVSTYADALTYMASVAAGLVIVDADESEGNAGTAIGGGNPRTAYLFVGVVRTQLVLFL